MRDEVAVKRASQILATGGITEQQLQLLHSEKLYHIGSKAMLPMGCPQPVTEYGRVMKQALSWTQVPPISFANTFLNVMQSKMIPLNHPSLSSPRSNDSSNAFCFPITFPLKTFPLMNLLHS